MKDLLATLWDHLKNTSAQTRLVVGAAALVLLAVAGVMGYRAANPHMVLVWSGLDNAQFSAVTNSLANAGVRFDTSSPPQPFSVFVPRGKHWDARNAVAAAGSLDGGTKGIVPAEGASRIFTDSLTRLQENQKRDWQDLEQQLEALAFVQSARVRTSGPPPSPLLRSQPPTVSVVVTLRGALPLDAGQRRTLASIVRDGAGVPDENITISDQNGRTLFDGSSDRSLDDVLRFENQWADQWTARAQEQLDAMFGVGLTYVSVVGEFDHVREESVDESLDPKQLKVSESLVESSTPLAGDALAQAGGPAGVQTNLGPGTPPTPSGGEATELESETRYTYGHTTTHKQKSSPALLRMAVTLAVHDSLVTRLDDAEGLVKRLVRFDDERDDFYRAALPLAGVEVDDEGQPVPASAEPPPSAPNRWLTLLIERGVEILAAGAFLLVLLKGLKRGVLQRTPTVAEQQAAAAAAVAVADEELDLDLLARKHVEQMLEEDPERVAALLSRWAMGENFYAGARS